jgi:hypothetical protein
MAKYGGNGGPNLLSLSSRAPCRMQYNRIIETYSFLLLSFIPTLLSSFLRNNEFGTHNQGSEDVVTEPAILAPHLHAWPQNEYENTAGLLVEI